MTSISTESKTMLITEKVCSPRDRRMTFELTRDSSDWLDGSAGWRPCSTAEEFATHADLLVRDDVQVPRWCDREGTEPYDHADVSPSPTGGGLIS